MSQLVSGAFLPAVPLICFLVWLPGDWQERLTTQVPGLKPLFLFLEKLQGDYGMHAAVGLLTGLLLGWLALTRRSPFQSPATGM